MNRFALVVLLATLVGLAGCQASRPAAEAPTIKIGVLPIVDVLPLYVADEEGIFARHGVQVELVPFSSAVERDTALQARQIDGQLNDLVATLLLIENGQRVKVVRQTYQGRPDKPMMYVLAAPNSDIRSPADLRGVEIAVSTNSVIEYATEAILRQAGLDRADIATVEVSRIPVRFDLLTKGQLRAATLPDPLASLAIAEGAHLVASDAASGAGQSVLTLREETLTAEPDAVRRLLAAYEEAVDRLNSAPEKYADLLAERAKVPDRIKDSFTTPRYPAARVSTPDEVAAVVDWMLDKGLMKEAVPYEQVVTEDFLPGR